MLGIINISIWPQKKSPVWRDSKFYFETINLNSVAPLWLSIKVKAKKIKIRLS